MLYTTIVSEPQAILMFQTGKYQGLASFHPTLLSFMQDVTKEEALELNTLCLRKGLPQFQWQPPLVATPDPTPTSQPESQ